VGHDGLLERLDVLEAKTVGPQKLETPAGDLAARHSFVGAPGRRHDLGEGGLAAVDLAQEFFQRLQAICPGGERGQGQRTTREKLFDHGGSDPPAPTWLHRPAAHSPREGTRMSRWPLDVSALTSPAFSMS